MFAQYVVLIVLSTFTLTLANDDPSLNRFRGHVLKTDGKYEIVTALETNYKGPTSTDNVLAIGQWEQNYNVTGWSVLQIITQENQTNLEQAYAAGLLEGQLTQG
jgi:hypothetical protein